jgi:hypothetical protein
MDASVALPDPVMLHFAADPSIRSINEGSAKADNEKSALVANAKTYLRMGIHPLSNGPEFYHSWRYATIYRSVNHLH